ncbi:MAG TPA: hypothetical protein VMZ26_06025 [Pyrinomonadaceae bacterium]|nr:hypothetical protein [Pyrinomonadaceae bacterium]
MKTNKKFNALNSTLLVILSLTFIGWAQAQSTDMDNPTAITSNVIDGEGDGKAETFYYSFTANKGDVKVTVDAKTDYYSTPLRVTLMDVDGNELVPIYVVAKDTSQRQVATKHFVRDTKVIVRVAMEKDQHVKLLTYKIKLDGAVTVETPPAAAVEVAPAPTADPAVTASPAAAPTATPAEAMPAAASDPAAPKTSTKEKVKAKAKKEVKKVVDGILDN